MIIQEHILDQYYLTFGSWYFCCHSYSLNPSPFRLLRHTCQKHIQKVFWPFFTFIEVAYIACSTPWSVWLTSTWSKGNIFILCACIYLHLGIRTRGCYMEIRTSFNYNITQRCNSQSQTVELNLPKELWNAHLWVTVF